MMLDRSFSEKYTSISEAKQGRQQIGDDAFAIGEVIEQLINKLEKIRVGIK